MEKIKLDTLEKCESAIKIFEQYGHEVPEQIREKREEFLKSNEQKSKTPIYFTLLKNYPYKPINIEKTRCIEETVNKLMESGPNAEEPCLLLGKIQCGKTDTFEDIIGLSFDKGIDIAIVLTKGTNALASQTIMRMRKDYRFFKQSDDLDQKNTISIIDVMNLRNGLSQSRVDGCKTVIVCKKQATNMKHLIDLFSKKDTYLKKKKILIVDDEADFASRNYKSVKRNSIVDNNSNQIKQISETTIAKISQQIDDFRQLPEYCRYLQVTATPYCLYLQPQGELYLNGNKIMPFKPRFTSLVPVHDKYIGGKEYFEDSQDSESMYSNLFHQVEQKCIDILGHEDKRYLKKSIASENLNGLRYAFISYLMGTAVRRIQRREEENKDYQSSALIHVEIDKKNHEWQYKVIDCIKNAIMKNILDGDNSDPRITQAIDVIYNDFSQSNKKGQNAGFFKSRLPSKEEITKEIRYIFENNKLEIKKVNSDNDVNALLDQDTGELRIDGIANIFIGGNILDRGITIKNMLCFFYGRNPKSFQQDTVLQHARMYGARDKKDMAVTRFHTTDYIHKILTRMNDLDNQLRQWFIDGRDQEEPNAIFVGYDKNIKPCSSSKIKASNALTLKQQQRILPIGFKTGKNNQIRNSILEIDELIKNSPNYNQQDENCFFEIDKELAFKIVHLIGSTYVYNENNKDRQSDIKEMLCAMEFCITKSDGKLWALHRVGRKMNRIRENGGYIDAPDDGRTDTHPSREKAIDKPVLMLLREDGAKLMNGKINIGWENAPFYWPVFMTQQRISPVMFAIDPKKTTNEFNIDFPDIISNIDYSEILPMTYSGNLEDRFGPEGKEWNNEECFETKAIKESTAHLYIEKDELGTWKLNTNALITEELYSGIYSLNNGIFPFVLHHYKYILIQSGKNTKKEAILLQLAEQKYWKIEPITELNKEGDLIDMDSDNVLIHAKDILTDKKMHKEEVILNNVCQWTISYKIKKVVKLRKLSTEIVN